MKFTVVYLPGAEAMLADLWMGDRKPVTDAANWIDHELSNNPLAKVTPVDDLYFLRHDPLIMLCKINVDDRMVRIIEVHRTQN